MDSDTLPLARSAIDRDAPRRRDGIEALVQSAASVRVLQVGGGQVAGDADGLRLGERINQDRELVYLGVDGEGVRYLAELGSEGLDGATVNIRDLGWQLSARDAGLATAALGLAHWHATNRFCPRCGAPTLIAVAGWERHCTAEGTPHFPRTDPAVIMAITDSDDRLLLGHAVGWPSGQFSVPAGFVEPGESLESAVRREVQEETAVTVGRVRYGASQPWPFPASLMLGFFGEALTNEPVADGVEMAEAMFVSRSQLAQLLTDGAIRLPRATSIAHHLVKQWYGSQWPDTGWRLTSN
ncbi:MAG: NAD(+) diphosphatase [Beutenbergiaceae bacterium]